MDLLVNKSNAYNVFSGVRSMYMHGSVKYINMCGCLMSIDKMSYSESLSESW